MVLGWRFGLLLTGFLEVAGSSSRPILLKPLHLKYLLYLLLRLHFLENGVFFNSLKLDNRFVFLEDIEAEEC